ncbi:MAG TPA: DUF2304 domain-containing protein [Pirellulales bacterium]|nr:DUF2304 domain-containing protein [Pirellulales bacterium]
MNLFQWIALSIILIVLAYELYVALTRPVARGFWVARVVTLIATGFAIYRPDVITRLASTIGIQRGADLVLYLTVLTFFATSIFLYARCVRLQRQITLIVRHLALEEAEGSGRMEGWRNGIVE